tara:strand:- start:1265 stop:1471 length:207 start_codon:yes stop_codon:yes gene_type:complete
MSGEQTSINSNYHEEADQIDTKKRSKKVDINILLNKVRKEKKKEKIEGYIFLGLVSSVILICGIIVSL